MKCNLMLIIGTLISVPAMANDTYTDFGSQADVRIFEGVAVGVRPGDSSGCTLYLAYQHGEVIGATIRGWGSSSFGPQQYVDYNTVSTLDEESIPLQEPLYIEHNSNSITLTASRRVEGDLSGFLPVDLVLGRWRPATSTISIHLDAYGQPQKATGEFSVVLALSEKVHCQFN